MRVGVGVEFVPVRSVIGVYVLCRFHVNILVRVVPAFACFACGYLFVSRLLLLLCAFHFLLPRAKGRRDNSRNRPPLVREDVNQKT